MALPSAHDLATTAAITIAWFAVVGPGVGALAASAPFVLRSGGYSLLPGILGYAYLVGAIPAALAGLLYGVSASLLNAQRTRRWPVYQSFFFSAALGAISGLGAIILFIGSIQGPVDPWKIRGQSFAHAQLAEFLYFAACCSLLPGAVCALATNLGWLRGDDEHA